MDRQIRRVGMALLLCFGALFVKLNDLQVLRADDLANDPRNTRVAIRDFSRPRGVIQTADGVVLARSVPADSEFELLREYPEGALFAHVAGYFSFTFGAEGVERTYNNELSGRALPVPLRRIGDVLRDNRPNTGTVTLSLTKRVQEAAATALDGRKGAVVALDPTTGAILAMTSFPSFDPNPLAAHNQQQVHDAWNALNSDANQPLLPRAYRRAYSPGSTFKVVTGAAALERAPEIAARSYPVLRALDLPQTDRDLPNFGGGACGGALPALLRVSCNTGFGQMGLDLGAENLHDEAEDFGFNSRPPLDLPAPARSTFPSVDTFERNLPALAQSAIGQQDVTATPLQMALVAGAVGNGGVVMEPHVLAELRDSEGALVRTGEPKPWMRATSPQTAEALRAAMVDVVRSGTARGVALPGIQVAAKTGTAQTTGDNAHAWIVAFAPAEAPRVAVAVIVESQPGVGDQTGGRVAAPIAKAVLAAALQG